MKRDILSIHNDDSFDFTICVFAIAFSLVDE